ncbi:MAG: hypothetical protein NTY25_01045, partial [Planctomycetia bacterium]|nr:hypothetical protein [Planctomycetia bacterium]
MALDPPLVGFFIGQSRSWPSIAH